MFKTGEFSSTSTRCGAFLSAIAMCVTGVWGSTGEATAQEQQTSFQSQSGQQHSFAPPAMSVDCATIRYHVAEHGKAKSIAWAVKNGYSWAQINEARRCLKG